MIYPVLRLRIVLPTFLALLLVTGSPLLHRIHLAGCFPSWEQISVSYGSREGQVHGFISIKNTRTRVVPSSNRRHRQHDSRHCPVCKMYEALYSGFNIPQLLPLQTFEIVLSCAVVLPEHLPLLLSYFLSPSRSPPVL